MAHVPPRYWFDGVEVEVTDIFEEFTNFAAWNPATDIVSGVGIYEPSFRGPVLTASAFAAVGLEWTVVFETNNPDGINSSVNVDMIDDPDYAGDIIVFLNFGGIEWRLTSNVSFEDPEQSVTIFDPIADGSGVHKSAATVTTSRLAESIDGRAVVADDYSPHIDSIFDHLGMISRLNEVRTVCFYSPQPEADLSLLSAI